MTRSLSLALLAFALLAGCGKKEPAPAGQSASSPASSSRPSAANDYSRPALSDEKIARFIDSMKEEHNPLEFIFRPGGAMRSMTEMKAKEVELTAFAKKYGFKDYTEYIDTWGRVMVGQMQIAAAGMMSGLKDSFAQTIRTAEEQLKKPSLSADERKMYTEQSDSAKKSLADLEKPSDSAGLNTADLELVKKYNDQLNEASKKYKAQRGQ